MELGIYTFADLQPDRVAGKAIITHQRLKEIHLADQSGLNVFGVGGAPSGRLCSSSPAFVLGAAGSMTKNIKLSSVVTVLS